MMSKEEKKEKLKEIKQVCPQIAYFYKRLYKKDFYMWCCDYSKQYGYRLDFAHPAGVLITLKNQSVIVSYRNKFKKEVAKQFNATSLKISFNQLWEDIEIMKDFSVFGII